MSEGRQGMPRDSYPSVPELPPHDDLGNIPDRSILILLYEQVMKLSIAWQRAPWAEMSELVNEKRRRESDARYLKRTAQGAAVKTAVAAGTTLVLGILGTIAVMALSGRLHP